MRRSTNSAVVAIVCKDLRTNRMFLGLAALAHILYVALILQMLAPERYRRAAEPLRQMGLSDFVQAPILGIEISIILAIATLVLIQTDGLAEPYHDSHIRPITPFQILTAKFIGLVLVIFIPRFLFDLAGSLLLNLSLTEGFIAASLHLLSDLLTACIVGAVATVTSTLGQALLATLLATLAFVVSGFIPSWLRVFNVPHGAGAGGDLSTVGARAMVLAANGIALLMLIRCRTPSQRRLTRKIAALGLLLFPVIAGIDFFIAWPAPKLPQTVRNGDPQVSLVGLSSADMDLLKERLVPYDHLVISASGRDDWLVIDLVDGFPKALPNDTHGHADWVGEVGGGFRRVLMADPGRLEGIRSLEFDITAMTHLGTVPLTRNHRYRAVPGGGACRLWHSVRRGHAQCVAALEPPCVSFGYPHESCPEINVSYLFRWPSPWSTSSEIDGQYVHRSPQETLNSPLSYIPTANFWRNHGHFERQIILKQGESRKLILAPSILR